MDSCGFFLTSDWCNMIEPWYAIHASSARHLKAILKDIARKRTAQLQFS